jgi:hypothetical protein
VVVPGLLIARFAGLGGAVARFACLVFNKVLAADSANWASARSCAAFASSVFRAVFVGAAVDACVSLFSASILATTSALARSNAFWAMSTSTCNCKPSAAFCASVIALVDAEDASPDASTACLSEPSDARSLSAARRRLRARSTTSAVRWA